MTAATIRVQQAGGTRIALERLYEIARQEERAVLQLLEKARTYTHADHGGSKTTMSLVKDSEGFFTVNVGVDLPSSREILPRHQERSCELTSSWKIFRRPGRMI